MIEEEKKIINEPGYERLNERRHGPFNDRR